MELQEGMHQAGNAETSETRKHWKCRKAGNEEVPEVPKRWKRGSAGNKKALETIENRKN